MGKKILLVSSTGGHLYQLYQLKDWWQDHDRAWVTFKKNDAKSLLNDETCHWAYHLSPVTRHSI